MTELYLAYWTLGAYASAFSKFDDASPNFVIDPEENAPSYHAVVDVPHNTGEYVL